MSYIQYPRLYFSGKFKASPSTINNAPNNYNDEIYHSPHDLEGVELYWNPKGDGGFLFENCVVTRVDYDENTSATTPEEDTVIGTAVSSVVQGHFPLPAAMVDLDPYQQNVSEIWALHVKIGDDNASVSGSFAHIAFNAIWQQTQDAHAPHSSASGSGVYQSTLNDISINGNAANSRFLQMLQSTGKLSMNFNLSRHNNTPQIYSFNTTTFTAMATGKDPVPQEVLDKLSPMKSWMQNIGGTLGDIPVEDFTVFMLQQLLPLELYNENVDKIIACAKQSYTGSTPEDFMYGYVTGTVGAMDNDNPSYFVPTRMLCPYPGVKPPKIYFAPFVLGANGKSISLNLGNSLCTSSDAGFTPYVKQLGNLSLVAFPGGDISLDNVVHLADIPYTDADFIDKKAGFFNISGFSDDYSQTPLGIISTIEGKKPTILSAENPDGYYMRADQFVFRMNPGVPAPSPRGVSNKVDIFVTKWGLPAANIEVKLSLMTPDDAQAYTVKTLGTGGTKGIDCMSIPQDAISLNNTTVAATNQPLIVAATTDTTGKASFDMTATSPGNPRKFVDGQVYLLEYGFADSNLQEKFIQDANDKISILIFDETTDLTGEEILCKWGKLYKIMYFLAEPAKVTDITFSKVIKQMLELPFDKVDHMPLTRDLGDSQRTTVINWINTLSES